MMVAQLDNLLRSVDLYPEKGRFYHLPIIPQQDLAVQSVSVDPQHKHDLGADGGENLWVLSQPRNEKNE